jgi:hypothetical protein
MAEAELNEAAKAELEAGRALRERSMKEFGERTKGRPTPTQEENDEAALGRHIMDKEPDGSDPDPVMTKNLEASKGGGYTTRQAQPAKPAAPKPTT